MEHLWPVTVVDDAAKAVTGARVCLVPASALGAEHFPYPSVAATHSDKGSGKYEPTAPIAPAAGNWVLIVTLKGKSPVVQRLKITAKGGGDFSTAARGGAVATVNMTSATRTVGKSKSRKTTFKVTLFPAAELVFFAGVDYSKRDVSTGWMFHNYGFGRAEALRREKKINAGTIVTVFSLAKITRTTRVWGDKKWVDVEVAQLGDPATRVLPLPGRPYEPKVGLDIHPMDFYKYLDGIGKREPGSVREAGIFSHSYPGGPILYNTGEGLPFRGTPARDPDDFDARAKDFDAANIGAGYPDMPRAFAAGSRFTIWGCSATRRYKDSSRQALDAIRRKLSEGAFFVVNTEYDSHGHPPIVATDEERTSELRHRWRMDAQFREKTYAASAARALGIEVRSACPGCGSDPVSIEGVEALMVNVATYKPVFDYFHLKFAPEFSETNGKWDKGYVDFHRLQSRPVVPKPGFDSEYYLFHIQRIATPWAAVGAKLEFWHGKSVTHPTADVSLVVRAVPDVVAPGKKGHLHVLRDIDDTKSHAVFLQEDGRLFKITRDAAGRWTVVGAEI
jgi:hypothetical protein